MTYSIVNEVIRGNFTSTKRIKSIKSIKSIKMLNSDFDLDVFIRVKSKKRIKSIRKTSNKRTITKITTIHIKYLRGRKSLA